MIVLVLVMAVHSGTAAITIETPDGVTCMREVLKAKRDADTNGVVHAFCVDRRPG